MRLGAPAVFRHVLASSLPLSILAIQLFVFLGSPRLVWALHFAFLPGLRYTHGLKHTVIGQSIKGQLRAFFPAVFVAGI